MIAGSSSYSRAGAAGPRSWPATQRPSAETGEALAASLDQLNSVVQPHLDDEEQEVVPLAAVTLTQRKWDAMRKHSVAQIPARKRGIAFGVILEPLGEADRTYMKRVLPAPVRALYPLLIERPWRLVQRSPILCTLMPHVRRLVAALYFGALRWPRARAARQTWLDGLGKLLDFGAITRDPEGDLAAVRHDVLHLRYDGHDHHPHRRGDRARS